MKSNLTTLPTRPRLAAVLATAALAAGLAGCSGGGSGSSASGGGAVSDVAAAQAPPAARDGLADEPQAFSGEAATGRTTSKTAGKASTRLPEGSFLGRDVIATAQVTVRTTDVTRAREQVGDLLRRYVGYVAEERTERNRKGETVRSVLQLRVPTERFDAALTDLEGLAPQVDVDRSTEDVTQQVIDVASRIRTQEISLGRLRRFLDRATTVDGIVRLESEIARREGDLGSLRAQQRQLADLTAESTITVHLEHVAKAEPKPEPKKAGTGFLAGLSTGWGAFTAAVVGLSQAAGVVLPFAVALALVGVPLLLWLRRRRRAAPLAEPAS